MKKRKKKMIRDEKKKEENDWGGIELYEFWLREEALVGFADQNNGQIFVEQAPKNHIQDLISYEKKEFIKKKMELKNWRYFFLMKMQGNNTFFFIYKKNWEK